MTQLQTIIDLLNDLDETELEYKLEFKVNARISRYELNNDWRAVYGEDEESLLEYLIQQGYTEVHLVLIERQS